MQADVPTYTQVLAVHGLSAFFRKVIPLELCGLLFSPQNRDKVVIR